MKRRHYPLMLVLFVAQVAVTQHQWAWITGEKLADINGIYGDRSVAHPSNNPGSRTGAAFWTDAQGNFWLFGGRGNGENQNTGLLNDLWKYNPSSNKWTWMSGPKITNTPGAYGAKGSPTANTQPGARQNAVAWTDNRGNFWLFGGSGVGFREQKDEEDDGDDNDDGDEEDDDDGDDDGDEDEEDNDTGDDNGNADKKKKAAIGLLNDLWMYSLSSGQWTWISGSDLVNQKGKYGKLLDVSKSNFPGGRSLATGWKDALGNLWLFGGNGYSSKSQTSDLNDIWRYSPATNHWTWMNGDKSEARDHYGQKGVYSNANTPGGRQGSTGWTDKQGNFWIFGGAERSNLFSDLWKYNPNINQWAWISGNNTPNLEGVSGENESPGARMLASGWEDDEGNLWLFGGNGYRGRSGANPLNNLWKYAIATNQWRFIKGDISNPKAVFGAQGVAAPGNQPGGMANSARWKDNEGNFWIFGGESPEGDLNQTWKFLFSCNTSISGALTPATSSICEGGSQVLTASGGASYEWRRNDVIIAGETNSTITATQPGTYSVIIKNGSCSGPAANTATITLATTTSGTIAPASASLCEGGSQTLTASGGASYEWRRDDVIIAGETKSTITAAKPGTYSVIIKNGSCSGPAANTATITLATTTSGTIAPASASLCEGGSQTLTASGGASYEWRRDDVIIAGETKSTITATQPGTYSVIIKNGSCSGSASNVSIITFGSAAGIRYTDVKATVNVPTRLSARQIGITYEWSPVTGLDNPLSATPMVSASKNIQYLVRITPARGCMIIDTVQVKVGEEKKIYVPTAFTPNGNNVNDLLRPLPGLAAIEYFKVYNRWGNIVFQTNVTGVGWDGKLNGISQPADAYAWILSATTLNGEPVKQSGKTQLVR